MSRSIDRLNQGILLDAEVLGIPSVDYNPGSPGTTLDRYNNNANPAGTAGLGGRMMVSAGSTTLIKRRYQLTLNISDPYGVLYFWDPPASPAMTIVHGMGFVLTSASYAGAAEPNINFQLGIGSGTNLSTSALFAEMVLAPTADGGTWSGANWNGAKTFWNNRSSPNVSERMASPWDYPVGRSGIAGNGLAWVKGAPDVTATVLDRLALKFDATGGTAGTNVTVDCWGFALITLF